MDLNTVETMENFFSRCLLCTCRPNVSQHFNIFSEAGNQLQLSEKISKYLNIQIDAELPQNVCHSCMAKLEMTHQLVTSSQQAGITLLQIKQQIEKSAKKVQQENSDCSTPQLDSNKPSTNSAVNDISPDTRLHDPKPTEKLEIRAGTSITGTISRQKKGKIVRKDFGGEVACDICNEIVTHKFCLIQHKNQKHNLNLSFNCKHCGAKCSNLIQSMQHVSKNKACDVDDEILKVPPRQHRNGPRKLLSEDDFQPVNCGICNFTSRNKFSLLTHINHEHLDVVVVPLPFRCELCNKEFSTYSNLMRHVTDMHTPKLQCSHCDKKFNRSKMNKHLQLHHAESTTKDTAEVTQMKTEPFEEILISDFVIHEESIKQEPEENQIDFSPHGVQGQDAEHSVQSEHSDCQELGSEFLMECELCTFCTDNKMELTSHMQTHRAPNTSAGHKKACNKQRRYAKGRKSRILLCPQCGVYYAYQEILAWHVENCHGSDAIVKVVKVGDTRHSYQCVICQSVFRTLDFTLSHLHTQHRITNLPFKCSICEKTFASKIHFRKHKIKCENGEFGFEKSNSPTKNTDQGIKCKMCTKVFKSEIQLNNHISTFHALKTQCYKCVHCDETFRFFPRLKTHCILQHPGKSVLQCEICNDHGFTTAHGYRLHKKTKHANLT